jgi:hypothetical protein
MSGLSSMGWVCLSNGWANRWVKSTDRVRQAGDGFWYALPLVSFLLLVCSRIITSKSRHQRQSKTCTTMSISRVFVTFCSTTQRNSYTARRLSTKLAYTKYIFSRLYVNTVTPEQCLTMFTQITTKTREHQAQHWFCLHLRTIVSSMTGDRIVSVVRSRP